MPPQGESTGIAIEDGVLIARVLRRRSHRSVQAMVADYEHVRRAVIDQHYQDAVRMQNITFPKVTGFASIAMEWVSSIFIYIRNWNQVDHFAGDVNTLALPD